MYGGLPKLEWIRASQFVVRHEIPEEGRNSSSREVCLVQDMIQLSQQRYLDFLGELADPPIDMLRRWRREFTCPVVGDGLCNGSQ
jgi:hypothetical protein